MLFDNDNMAMWVWATQHPYLYTLIKISTTVTLAIIFALIRFIWSHKNKR